jgi:hypothetical protein
MPSIKQTSNMRDIKASAKSARVMGEILSEKDMPFLINDISYISDSGTAYETLSALASDISKTAKNVIDVAAFVNAANSHVVSEIVDEENDLRKMYPNHYNEDKETLTIFGVKMKPGTDIYRKKNTEISEIIYNTAFRDLVKEFSFDDFKSVIRELRKVEESTPPGPESPNSARIAYVEALTNIARWTSFIPHIKALGDDVQGFKNKLGVAKRNDFVSRLSSGRAMIDGVTKASTYMSPNGGVHQVGNKHKKDKDLLQRVFNKMKEVPFVKGIEIDQNIPLEKFHDLLVAIKGLNLPIADAFELKGRMLGGYSACGISLSVGGESFIESRGVASSKMSIIGFDLDFASSVVHEITHFLDRPVLGDKSGQRQGAIRDAIATHMGKKIPRDELEELFEGVKGAAGKVSLIMSDREIVARLGEIGYLLNKHKYQDGESLDAFASRVREAETIDPVDDEKIGFDIQLVSKIDDYLGTNSLYSKYIYFNMEEWSLDDFKIVRDFAHDYFFEPNPDVTRRLKERWDNGELSFNTFEKSRMRRPLNKRPMALAEKELKAQGAALSKLPASSLVAFYKEGYRSGIFKEGEVLSLLPANLMRLGDGGGAKRKFNLQVMTKQVEGLISLVESIDEKSHPADALLMQGILFSMIKRNGIDVDPTHYIKSHTARRCLSFAAQKQVYELWGETPNDDVPDSADVQEKMLDYVAFEVLNEDLKTRFTSVVNKYLEKMSTFSPPMPDVSHLSKVNSYDIASLHFINRNHKFFEIKDENTFDYAMEMSLMHLGDYWGSRTDEDIDGIVNRSNFSSELAKFNTRELVNVLSPYEPNIVKMLVAMGSLKEWGVDPKSVEKFIADIKAKGDAPQQSLKSNINNLDELMVYLGSDKHDRRIKGAYDNIHFKSNEMSPLVAFLNMSYKYGKEITDDKVIKAFEKLDLFSNCGLRDASHKMLEYGDYWRKSRLEKSGGRAEFGENKPHLAWLESRYTPLEASRRGSDGLSFSSSLSGRGESVMLKAIVRELINNSKSEAKVLVKEVLLNPLFPNSSLDNEGRRVDIMMRSSESERDAERNGFKMFFMEARDDAREYCKPSNELHIWYDASRKHASQCVSYFDEWITDLGMNAHGPAAVLQAAQVFDSFSYSFSNANRKDSEIISKLGDLAKLYGVECGVISKDIRPHVDSVFERVELTDTLSHDVKSEYNEPAVEVESDLEVARKVEKPEIDEVNKEVPAVKEDGVFRKENQMSFF